MTTRSSTRARCGAVRSRVKGSMMKEVGEFKWCPRHIESAGSTEPQPLRRSIARCLALWAVCSATTPLPLMLANAEAHAGPVLMTGAAPALMVTASALAGMDLGHGGGDGGDDARSDDLRWSDVRPFAIGTLDELGELWPELVPARGLLLFIDPNAAPAEINAEIWGVFDRDAELVGTAIYAPLHASDVHVDETNGVPALQSALGLLTAMDGVRMGSAIGIEGVVVQLESTVAAVLAGGAFGTLGNGQGGLGAMPLPAADPDAVRDLPRPMLPVRSTSVPQALDAAEQLHAMDEIAAGDETPLCTNPQWLGFNGVECCQLFLGPAQAAIECRAAFWASLFDCLRLGMGSGAVGIVLTTCVYKVPPLAKYCLAAILGLALVAVIFCWNVARKVEEACIATKLRENRELLVTSGCAWPPPGGNP